MPKYTVDVSAFFAFEVTAENEEDARIAADAFIENVMAATPDTVTGYNSGLPEDARGQIVPSEICASIDGSTDVQLDEPA